MRRPRRIIGSITMWTVRLLFAVVLAFPFYWMLITTFKKTTDLYNLKNNPFIFNEPPTLEHLRLLFQETLFLRWVGNTVFAGTIVVIVTLLLSIPAAYALARLTGNWGAQLGIGGVYIREDVGGSALTRFDAALTASRATLNPLPIGAGRGVPLAFVGCL